MFNLRKTVLWAVSVAIPGAGAYFSPEGFSEALWAVTGISGVLSLFGLKENKDLGDLGYIHGVRSSKWGRAKIGMIWEWIETTFIEPVAKGVIEYLQGYLNGGNKDD